MFEDKTTAALKAQVLSEIDGGYLYHGGQLR